MKIPLPTLIMLQASKLVQDWWWLVALALAALVVGFRLYIGTPAGPAAGGTEAGCVFRCWATRCAKPRRRVSRAPWPRWWATACRWCSRCTFRRAFCTTRRMANALKDVAQGVKRGEGISQPLARTKMFPPLASHLLTVGEETGKLDLMFARMADIYEEETRASIKRFTAIFEPLMILVMGMIVGALVFSMLIAITSINDVAI